MDFDESARTRELRHRLEAFMDDQSSGTCSFQTAITALA